MPSPYSQCDRHVLTSLLALPCSMNEVGGSSKTTNLFIFIALTGLILLSASQARGNPTELRDLALKHTDSLKAVTVPDSPNFKKFVKDREALKILGKALFWDQQVGSDGQACASCHFHAGADNRSKNQLNPGFRNQTPGVNSRKFNDQTFNQMTGGLNPNLNAFGPNYPLTAADFPFHKLADVNDRTSTVISDTNDVASSMGVFNAAFKALGIPNDVGEPLLTGHGAVFNVGDVLVRNVEPRNTPTVINAVLNHRNFWDSRAQNAFNGRNPFRDLDPTVKLVKAVPIGQGKPNNAVLVQLRTSDCSGCSQADGPPLSDLEMSFAGRKFWHVGRKMLNPTLVALGQQLVATTDSVLSPYYSNQNPPFKGISLKYANLIKQAFNSQWWDAPAWVVDVSDEKKPKLVMANPGPNRFTVMEYNFPLYFGLAVNEYEKTLIADDTPFDQFMEGDLTALNDQEQRGLEVFLGQGRCINCHSGPELTNASLTNVRNFEILERMVMGDNRVAVYDNGHYNIGVRPTLEDIGVGGAINNVPLSNSRRFQNCVKNKMAAGLDLRAANQECSVPRILARPEEAATLLAKAAALLPGGDPTRTAAEALIAEGEALLATEPPDLVTASCKLAKNPALPCPTVTITNPDGTTTTVQEDGALDLLAAVPSPPAGLIDLLAAAASLLPDTVTPGTAPEFVGPPLRPGERVAVDGAMKTPSVRTLEFTAPYFHNGGMATLEQVVEFYNRGGDFAIENQDNLDPDIQPLGLTDQEKEDLVAFLKALTDERVRYDAAPFDHPSLNVPNGGSGFPSDPLGLFNTPVVMDNRVCIPAVGAGGNPPNQPLGTDDSPSANFLQNFAGACE